MRGAEVDIHRFLPTLGELDLHLLAEGRHHRLWTVLGAHPRVHQGVAGTSFAVMAPAAAAVSVVGDFNSWEEGRHPLRRLGSGVWERFLPGVDAGARYRLAIRGPTGELRLKADPVAFAAEPPPGTASIVTASSHEWGDAGWMAGRPAGDPGRRPLSIYELHAGSWRRPPGYVRLARALPEHAARLGFTHVELMPLAEHPFAGSWGYQASSYYAPTARLGSPDALRRLVDALHARGIGVILDWVPGHFARDEWALADLDGGRLYEREGAHERWGTPGFDLGRNEVRNFLLANALYWLEEFHCDGLRVDGVSSLLYQDYDRDSGEWVPGPIGNRPNLQAVDFLHELTETVRATHPDVLLIAEESTAWPGITRPTDAGGLGFTFKWNMGWMHDTLAHLALDPGRRAERPDLLTFGLLYAHSESFVLPLSHDEVAQGKGSLLSRIGGDPGQRLSGLRALYAWMWAHPGKKLLFMGGELGQEGEWDHDGAVEWELLERPEHRGVLELIGELNRVYRAEPALWEGDALPEGFSWLDTGEAGILAFLRLRPAPGGGLPVSGGGPPRGGGLPVTRGGRLVACVANLTDRPVEGHRLRLPRTGRWAALLSTADPRFGGAGGTLGSVEARPHPHLAAVDLPPLTVIWLASPPEEGTAG